MEIKDAILLRVEEVFQIAENYFGRKFSRPTNFVWEREKSRGGYCKYLAKELGFNTLLAENNKDHFLATTVPHEVAHWIDRELYGFVKTPAGKIIRHGKTWKRIMVNVFRIPANRCHTYDTSMIKKRTRVVSRGFVYGCGCGKTYNLTSVRHNKIVKGKAWYHCTSCKGKLYPITQKSPQELEIERLTRQLESLRNKKAPH